MLFRSGASGFRWRGGHLPPRVRRDGADAGGFPLDAGRGIRPRFRYRRDRQRAETAAFPVVKRGAQCLSALLLTMYVMASTRCIPVFDRPFPTRLGPVNRVENRVG